MIITKTEANEIYKINKLKNLVEKMSEAKIKEGFEEFLDSSIRNAANRGKDEVRISGEKLSQFWNMNKLGFNERPKHPLSNTDEKLWRFIFGRFLSISSFDTPDDDTYGFSIKQIDDGSYGFEIVIFWGDTGHC
jgi:hypothetical protein